MSGGFRLVTRKQETAVPRLPDGFTEAQARKVREYHRTFPMYCPTPMACLPETAALLGLGGIYIKDESKRFGLNAFKVLGGSYAIGCCLAERLGCPPEEMSYELLTAPETRERLGDLTFITATDGNHGRGAAWSAARFGMRSVVYMPKGTVAERLNNIRAAGADAEITAFNYDDTVRLAAAHARENGWILVQDTSWEGYEEIPARIMQGYGTMALEAAEQLPEPPTHVFLQAGVGSMAAAVAAVLTSVYGESRPKIIVVEPEKADCFYRTAEADDGCLHAVTGEMNTIMAGLACGEPCSLAWDILKDCADFFLSCPEYAAAKGMRILGNPPGEDDRVISGESGASTFGCAAVIMSDPAQREIRERLGLNRTSRILCFSTEGATDTENYRAVVWDGRYPSE